MTKNIDLLIKQNEIRKRIDILKRYCKLYEEGKPAISDSAYDRLYFELKQIEEDTGIIYPDSPTQSIPYEVVNNLIKVEHNHPMLSLDKTKDFKEVKEYFGDFPVVAMCKMDGLTCSLTYQNGELIRAETRGNGQVGEDITHNARVIPSIPKKVPAKGELIVDGEVISTKENFKRFEDTYKNPRNFASGSVRLLDSNECANRGLTFVAWDEITTRYDENHEYYFHEKLDHLSSLGFIVVPNYVRPDVDEEVIELLQKDAEDLSYPIDGLVFKFDDVGYGNSLGATSHHMNSAYAFKFYDEAYPTILQDIEWSLGRTGKITPVAIFDDIEFSDATVNRASLHNLSIIESLFGPKGPYKGQTIYVSKRNMIIPTVEEVDEAPEGAEKLEIPIICPCCGKPVVKKTDYESTFLVCENPDCQAQIINKIEHFASKKGLDIKGLSKATLEKLIDWGWVNNCGDLFTLQGHQDEWTKKSGFGTASVDKVLSAINTSTNCALDKFICALGIPLIGATASKALAREFHTWNNFIKAVEDNYKFYQINGFGREMSNAIREFNFTEAKYIAHNFMTFGDGETVTLSANGNIIGKTFVITGKLQTMNRDTLKEKIEKLGGKVTNSVTSKTDYLINNDKESTSNKNLNAQKLGVPILSEKEFLKFFEI